MPTIPAFSLVSTTVDPAEIYDNMLYNAAAAPVTLENLNGGLDDTNYAAGNDSIRAYSVQSGTFCAGVWHGTDRWSYTYEGQVGGEDNADGRVPHDFLAARIWLPWTAGVVWFGYQGWFMHNAYRHDVDGSSGGPFEEFWSVQLHAQGTNHQALHTRLPTTMATQRPPTACDEVPEDTAPGTVKVSDEDRMKYVCKMGMAESVSKGYYDISIHLWASLFERTGRATKDPDPNWETSVEMRSGAVWLLAIR